ncbi:hypothetical protein AAW01_10500 [Aurantiacibacter gangjinensis]|uniref:Glycosyltransferase 2-like domain-containing protein n=2 Tax=Aurantiacibacter gangjinensis TaxID=502682 RepID=A0A0G9MNW4_9SPHN|nr:hypothetical protein AAW01_10500 [Aurantiacibacter gangjinensis]
MHDDKDTPAVSIVLPVHNGERFLRAALDSILAQTMTDFELIAVDDASSDSTPAILAHYAARDPRIRVITNPSNRKLPASLNTGFAATRAPWLTWTSDDNLLRPEMLARLVEARDAACGADIIHADYVLIDDAGRETGCVATGPANDLLLDNTIGCSFLYRREVDEMLGGYDESLFGLEDYDFWLRARAAGFTFHRIAEPLYKYRRHASSLTNSRAETIHEMVHERLSGEIEAMPRSPTRARARLRLATRNAYRLRPKLVARAFADHPPTVLRHWREIAGWLRHAARLRLRR